MRQISGSRVTRRQALAGFATAIAATNLQGSASAATDEGVRLLELGRALDRARRQITRLHRKVRALADTADRISRERGNAPVPDGRRDPAIDVVRAQIGYDRAWQTWSLAVDGSVELAVTIRTMPGTGVRAMSIKFDALIWELFRDDLAVGLRDPHLRRLMRFGRELRHVSEAGLAVSMDSTRVVWSKPNTTSI